MQVDDLYYNQDSELSPAEIKELNQLAQTHKDRELDLTPEQLEFVETKLSSKLWRMNNLYKIRDKDGNLITMKLNDAQMTVLTKFSHLRKIILKSRQQGISTLYLAYNLDDCLFKDGYQAGIQSYGLSESEKLSLRAELMWDELDPAIKELMGLTLIANNSKGMMFSNGSILKIGNFRGDTLQSLHVSELAKISRMYPEKAKELKTGAFQSVGKNNKITLESTAEGKTGLFYEIWNKSILKQVIGRLGPFDFQPIFLSWVIDADCNIDHEEEISKELEEYFSEIERELGITLEKTQKWWYAGKLNELGEDMKREYPSTAKEAFEQSVEGTYYKNEFQKLVIKPNLYDLNLKVFSAMDLGLNDTFSIGFFQVHPDSSVKIIGEYHNSGEQLSHYWDIFCYLSDTFGWVHGSTYVPHDVMHGELIAGKTRWDAMAELGFDTILVDKHGLLDGIEATRQFLRTIEIDESCEYIVESIQNYRKKYDRGLGVFLQSPVHDQYSHPADMVRYMAMGCRYSPISLSDIYVRQNSTRRRSSFDGYEV